MCSTKKKRLSKDFEDWLKSVRGTATSGFTTDEIMEMMRGPFEDLPQTNTPRESP